MDTDIDRKLKPRFATSFAGVPHGAGGGLILRLLILRLQSSAFSGGACRRGSDHRSLHSLIGIDAAKL
jgi:hypothetical protein